MWRVIFRCEWRRLFVEKTAWLILAALPMLILFGAFNGLRWTTFQRAAIHIVSAICATMHSFSLGVIWR